MKSTFYVQFVRSGYKVKAVHLTQKRPRYPMGGSILVRFSADLDDALFTIPDVSVTVPAEHGQPVRVETEPVGSDDGRGS